jgi:hypothetical protein
MPVYSRHRENDPTYLLRRSAISPIDVRASSVTPDLSAVKGYGIGRRWSAGATRVPAECHSSPPVGIDVDDIALNMR